MEGRFVNTDEDLGFSSRPNTNRVTATVVSMEPKGLGIVATVYVR